MALKKIKLINDSHGFPITSLREINILKQLSVHPNIVTLYEVVVGYKQESVFLAFEYLPCDMAHLVDCLYQKRISLSLAQTKCIMLQLIEAMIYLHDNNILH